MTERTGRPWLNYLLGLLCVGAIVAAILLVGPASGSTTAVTRTAKAAEGVVQSTVSGSGNLQPASQLNLGFKTSGTVTNIYVTQGEYVTEGQLLAELDPQSAEVTLEQAKAACIPPKRTSPRRKKPTAKAHRLGRLGPRRRERGGRIGSPNRRRKGAGIGARADCAERYIAQNTTHTTTAASSTAPVRTNPHDHLQDHRAQEQAGRIAVERLVLQEQRKLRLVEQSHRQRRHARSQPRLGQSGRQERPADGAERRRGGRRHQAVRAAERHDRLALRPGRRSRVRQRHHQGLEQQLLGLLGIGQLRDRRLRGDGPLGQRRLIFVLLGLRLLRAPPAPPLRC